jgi:half-pint family poly-U binding splicing factor
MEQTVKFVLVRQQQHQQKQQLDLIKKQQALLLMCRIYVGSIFYEVKEEAVRIAFTAFGPIRSISMSWDAATNKHKGFAFIEFETPEAAQLSLEQMNGLLLGGRNIKVGRPSNMPQAQPIIDQLTEEAKNYNRIYIASIHPDLSEQDVQSVFEAFGTIKSCSLVRDLATAKHKGYGFIEYETSQSAQDAITSMNLFDLGGQFLRVGRAVTPPDNVTTSLAGSLSPQQQSTTPTTPTLTPQTSTVITTPTSTAVKTPVIQQNEQPTTPIVKEDSSTVETIPVETKITDEAVENVVAEVVTPVHSTSDTSQFDQERKLTENQKKILGMTRDDDPSASLEHQVDITLKGKEQRLVLMQKLMQRKQESKILILRNMVGVEDVDEELESEISG